MRVFGTENLHKFHALKLKLEQNSKFWSYFLIFLVPQTDFSIFINYFSLLNSIQKYKILVHFNLLKKNKTKTKQKQKNKTKPKKKKKTKTKTKTKQHTKTKQKRPTKSDKSGTSPS